MISVFQDLDATLKLMLDDDAAPPAVRNADVSFDVPDREYKPAQATVNLFLYDVSENRALRDPTRVLERAGDVYFSRLPPLRVDCTYLTTAWSELTGGLKAREEHELLGLALAWLSEFPLVENRFLQGSLNHPEQPFPLPVAVAQVREGQGMGQFWTALGIAPRPAFSLTVTIAVQLSDEATQYPAVKAVEIQPAPLADSTLAGRILNRAGAVVTSAQVRVLGTDRQVAVDPGGRFAFSGLGFGQYILLVQMPDHADQRSQVEFTAQPEIHDVIVPGP